MNDKYEDRKALRELQERKDFYIIDAAFQTIFSGTNYTVETSQIKDSYSHIDCTCSVFDNDKQVMQYLIEIKENNSPSNYNTFPLKVSKYQHLKNTWDSLYVTRQTVPHRLLYSVINGDSLYIYTLFSDDGKHITPPTPRIWTIKETQYLANSPRKDFATYFLPKTLAKKYDVTNMQSQWLVNNMSDWMAIEKLKKKLVKT